ncbi:MAG: hypothetical protein R3C68_03100 [Myxococcota bacterium]
MSAHVGTQTGTWKINGSVALSNFLLHDAHVALVPGLPFGDDACVRISFAASEEDLKRGIERVGESLARLR